MTPTLAETVWQLCISLGSAAFAVDDLEHARECLLQAEEAADAFIRPDNRIGRTCNALGVLEFRSGRFVQAARRFEQAIAAAASPESADTALYIANLAATRAQLGETNEAEALYLRAIEIGSGAAAPDIQRAWDYDRLGALQCDASQYEAAVRNLARSLQLKGGERTWEVSVTLEKLATCLRGLKRDSEAERLLWEALNIKKALVGDDDPTLSSTYAALGRLYLDQSKLLEAERCMRRAVMTLDPRGPQFVEVAKAGLLSLAEICRRGGLIDRADRLSDLAQRVCRVGQLTRPDFIEALQAILPNAI